MLSRLSIRDFALIKELDLAFSPGLTMISGETGAGKSILLSALAFISGQRASRDFVRQGSSKAEVTCLFTDVYQDLSAELKSGLMIAPEDEASGDLLLRRQLDTSGRSTAWINGSLVTISQLRALGDELMALHAQHEEVTLFRTDKQQELLDRFAGDELDRLKSSWKALRKSRLDGMKELKELGLNPQQRAQELDLLNYQIDEIEAAFLPEEKLIKLQTRFQELSRLEELLDLLSQAIQLMDPEREYSGIDLLRQSYSLLEKMGQISPRMAARADIWDQHLTGLEEEVRSLKDQYEDFFQAAAQAEQVKKWMAGWQKIADKYGPTWQEVSDFLSRSKQHRLQLEASDRHFHELSERLKAEAQAAETLALAMHDLRAKQALALADAIEQSLADLNMAEARFLVQVTLVGPGEPGYWAEEGRDRVAFYIATNPGEDLMPLNKIASGGEASRILLAVKAILARLDRIGLLVFDEIDSGISGNTAHKLGLKLKDLARDRQVLAVTHTAQIAAMGDRHLCIHKTVQAGRTETHVSELSRKERAAELARLLAGTSDDPEALDLAQKLLNEIC